MSKIEWTDITWNPVWGCYGGCDYCYARSIAKRFARQTTVKEVEYSLKNNYAIDEDYHRVEIEKDLRNFEPTILLKNLHRKFPQKSKLIFVNSMSDIAFWNIDWIYKVLEIIRDHSQHTFQILTKFPEKLIEMEIEFPDNVWLGISAENQKDLIRRFAYMIQIKAGKHFISLEPLQGKIDLHSLAEIKVNMNLFHNYDKLYPLNWIIVGGQTGAKAKPMQKAWVTPIRNFCSNYGIPFFFKSWGAFRPIGEDDHHKFDNTTYNQFPESR